MFSPAKTSQLATWGCAALSAARSFLLLEDTETVDWEVDADGRAIVLDHPHREPLRGRPSWARRPGQPPSPAQVCVSPVARHAAARRQAPAGARLAKAPPRERAAR
jgi:hypothetical protein